jgi:hypothetical protein
VTHLLFVPGPFAVTGMIPSNVQDAPRKLTVALLPSPSVGLQLFSTEAELQTHCPQDQVVWLNTDSGISQEKGTRWYGNTKHGAYVCRNAADLAGDKDTRNGQ